MRRVLNRLAAPVRRRALERIAELEGKVARQNAKIADLQERRVVAQFGTPYAEGPRFRLDYDGAEIEVVAAARQRTARAQTTEPFTVAWLERTLRDGDVLYDVGANVGSYSLIGAAVAPGVRIVAFEPSFASFAVLCSNLAVNGLGDRVIPVPLPLGAETALTTLGYRSLGPGAPATREGDLAYEHRALGFSLDDLVRRFDLPPPTLLRLAVVGEAPQLVRGANEILGLEGLRGVLVELRAGDRGAVVSALLAGGLALVAEDETRAVFERHAGSS